MTSDVEQSFIIPGMVLSHPLKGSGLVTRVGGGRATITMPRCDADAGNPGIVRSIVAATRFGESSGMDVIIPVSELLNDESWVPGPSKEALLEVPSSITSARLSLDSRDPGLLDLALTRLVISPPEDDDIVGLASSLAELVDVTTLLALTAADDEDLLHWAARVTQVHRSSNLANIEATWHQWVLPSMPDASFELAMTLLSDLSRMHSLAYHLDVAQSVDLVLNAAEKRIRNLKPEIDRAYDDLLSKVQKKHSRARRR